VKPFPPADLIEQKIRKIHSLHGAIIGKTVWYVVYNHWKNGSSRVRDQAVRAQ
jgi:hypothetical protein